MKVSKLITEFRRRVDDQNTDPPLYDDGQIVDWLNEAMDEACIRGRLLTDSATADLCEIALVEGQAEYPLDPRIIEVTRVSIDDTRCDLDRIGIERLRASASTNNGLPTCYALEGLPEQGMTLVLDRPIAAQYDAMRIVVFRKQLVPLRIPVAGPTPIDDTPEIAEQFHRGLLHWMLHLAYDTRDSDKGDVGRSDRHERKFIEIFGVRPSASVMRKRLRHDPAVTVPDIRSTRRFRTRYRPTVDP